MQKWRGEIKMNFTLQLIYRELCGGCIKYIRYAKIRFQAGLAKWHCDIRAQRTKLMEIGIKVSNKCAEYQKEQGRINEFRCIAGI